MEKSAPEQTFGVYQKTLMRNAGLKGKPWMDAGMKEPTMTIYA
jgi:hypothetical protein